MYAFLFLRSSPHLHLSSCSPLCSPPFPLSFPCSPPVLSLTLFPLHSSSPLSSLSLSLPPPLPPPPPSLSPLPPPSRRPPQFFPPPSFPLFFFLFLSVLNHFSFL